MNKIESFKYIRPISPGTTSCYSVGDILPIEILWECNGKVYNRKQEKGRFVRYFISNMINVVGVVVESIYRWIQFSLCIERSKSGSLECV